MKYGSNKYIGQGTEYILCGQGLLLNLDSVISRMFKMNPLKNSLSRYFPRLLQQVLPAQAHFETKYSVVRHASTTGTQGKQSNGRLRLVILGTGWGGYSLLKNIDKKLFDVIVISPRNHFLFTPLLASTTVGTLEFRSIIEPVRNTKFRDDHHFQLAKAAKLHVDKCMVVCESVLNNKRYEVSYDKLVIAVGARSNTFNVPGVEKYAFFLKEIAHARAIRNQILTNFELSVHPNITPEEEKRLLHFVICGGGPTGVEFGAELYDFLREDVSRLYFQEKDKVQVTLVEPHQILPSFDKKLRAFAEKKIQQRSRFHLIQSGVVEVEKEKVKLQDGTILPCGLVVWSTGLAPRPFIGENRINFTSLNSFISILSHYLSLPSTFSFFHLFQPLQI